MVDDPGSSEKSENPKTYGTALTTRPRCLLLRKDCLQSFCRNQFVAEKFPTTTRFELAHLTIIPLNNSEC